jgi:hypothetical protein
MTEAFSVVKDAACIMRGNSKTFSVREGMIGEVSGELYADVGSLLLKLVLKADGSYEDHQGRIWDINGIDRCPICAEPFKSDDVCATDIELLTVHAECLEGCEIVDLETEEPTDKPLGTFPYSDLASPSPQPNLVAAELVDAPKVNENAQGSNGETSATCCRNDPNSDPKNENIHPPQNHLEGDNQPRYTTKRMHDEIAKAKALARMEVLDQLHSKALGQVDYFDRKQREFTCLDDCLDEEGELHLPDDIGPLLRHDHANGRMSEAAWWRDTLQGLKEETGTRPPQTNVIPPHVRDFIGKVQGVCMGVAMSGDDHPNPDGALMELVEEAQELLFPTATTEGQP